MPNLKKLKTQIKFSSHPGAPESADDSAPAAVVKFPTKVSILGTIYTVKYLSARSMGDDYGETDPDNRLIRIRKPTPSTIESTQATLFHEMLHASLHQSGLTHLLSDDNEEAIVRMLEQFVFPYIDVEKLMRQGGNK